MHRRALLLGGDFFLGAVIAATLTKLVRLEAGVVEGWRVPSMRNHVAAEASKQECVLFRAVLASPNPTLTL